MRKIAAVLVLVVAVLLGTVVPASADVRAEFALGILTVSGDGDGNDIVVACVNGNVRVNDAPPSGGRVRCRIVRSILVRAGDGADRVDLSGVGRTAFDVLLEVGVFGEAGNDTLTGSSLADRLEGGGGADTLRGGDGPDLLVPSGGGGELIGGAGADRATFSGGGHWVVSDERVERSAPAEVMTMQGVESVTVRGAGGPNRLDGTGFGGRLVLDGGAGPDDLLGGPGRDLLLGRAGNDVLDGAAGNDVLEGAGGNDRLRGGSGNDQLSGGAGVDDCVGGPGADSLLSC
ncbi:MAG: calcium-binding protein [Actinomycetota bacterium]